MNKKRRRLSLFIYNEIKYGPAQCIEEKANAAAEKILYLK